MLYKVALTLYSVIKSWCVAIHVKSTEPISVIMRYCLHSEHQLALIFKSVDETLVCDHSHKS